MTIYVQQLESLSFDKNTKHMIISIILQKKLEKLHL